MTERIGARIRALREENNFTQEDFAQMFGFDGKRAVSAIEAGERDVTANEIAGIIEKLDVGIDYFTDPFLLVGKKIFAWRQSNVSDGELKAYERAAGRWIGAYGAISKKLGHEIPLFRFQLNLTAHSKVEEAMKVGERFATEFQLGDVPASRLVNVMEGRLNILVLMVDATSGISGAACQLPGLDAVLVNRNEPVGCRNFNLAHELFHILTWKSMPPKYSEDAEGTSKNRVELLANKFALAVLMPENSLSEFNDCDSFDESQLISRLHEVAGLLQVSVSDLVRRLVDLGKLKDEKRHKDALSNYQENVPNGDQSSIPPQFSKQFVEVIVNGLKNGHVSARLTAEFLNLSKKELEDLFMAHGLDYKIGL